LIKDTSVSAARGFNWLLANQYRLGHREVIAWDVIITLIVVIGRQKNNLATLNE
jgi:hypothetical protein